MLELKPSLYVGYSNSDVMSSVHFYARSIAIIMCTKINVLCVTVLFGHDIIILVYMHACVCMCLTLTSITIIIIIIVILVVTVNKSTL